MDSRHSTQVELTSYAQRNSTTTGTDVETPRHDSNNVSGDNEGFSLPPTDRGKDAWLCLLACFMLEAMIWGKVQHYTAWFVITPTPGFPASYGVFQEFYSNEDFVGSSNIAVVGTCAMV
jgi:hypothetical protein